MRSPSTFDAASIDDELGERLQAGSLEREATPTAGFGAIEGFEVLQGGGDEDDEAAEEDPAEVRRERAREARAAAQRATAAERAADKARRRAEGLKEKAAAAVNAAREAESEAKRLTDEAKTERKRADRAAKLAERRLTAAGRSEPARQGVPRPARAIARSTTRASGSGTASAPSSANRRHARAGFRRSPWMPATPSKSGASSTRSSPATSAISAFSCRSASLGSASGGRVPVVHGDERQPDRPADPAEQRDVPLPTAFDDRDPLPVGIVSQRFEHEGQRELLGEPFHQDGGAGQEELAPRGVELGEGAELLVGGEGLGLQQERPDLRPAFGEHELVQPHDVQERGGVRGVEDLVAAGRDEPEQPVQVALRLRREEELGLLHQDDDTGDARLAATTPGRRPARARDAVAPVVGQPSDAASIDGRADDPPRPDGRAAPGRSGRRSCPSRSSAGKKSAGAVAFRPMWDPKARRRPRSWSRRRAPRRSGSTPSRRVVLGDVGGTSGAASGSRSAQIAVSRFDLPVLCSPTIAEIAPGRKLVSFSDRNPRTWTPVSPKAGTRGC